MSGMSRPDAGPGVRSTGLTPSTGLLSVFADVVILLTAAPAVARRSVSSLARPVVATFAFAGAWLLTAILEAIHAPGWTIFLGGSVIVVSIFLTIATLHVWTQEGDGGETGPGRRGDQGGGGPRPRQPDAPQHGGGGSDPSWWPEFERQLASYAGNHESAAGAPQRRPDRHFVEVDAASQTQRPNRAPGNDRACARGRVRLRDQQRQ